MKSKRTNKPNYRVNNSFLDSAHFPTIRTAMKVCNIVEYKTPQQLKEDAERVAKVANAIEKVKFFTLDRKVKKDKNGKIIVKAKSHLNGVKQLIGGLLCDDLILNSPNEYGQKGSWDQPDIKAQLNLIRQEDGIVNYKTRK